MSEVLPSLVRAAAALFDEARARKHAADLHQVLQALDGGTERVAWDEYATLLNRLSHGLTELEFERLGERYTSSVAEVRALAQLAPSPDGLLSLALRTVPVAWPHVLVEEDWVGPGEVNHMVELPLPYMECAFWMRSSVGVFRSLPRLLGLPDATIQHETSERHVRMHIRAPSAPSRALPTPVTSDVAMLVESLLAMNRRPSRPPAAQVPVALDLQRRWGLTRTEARVARRLASGMRLEEVARDLGVSRETVRTHLKSLFGKTDTRRQVELVSLIRGLPLDPG